MNPTSRSSMTVPLALAVLALLAVFGLSGCVRQHLSPRYGIAESQILELQIQPRLSKQDKPTPLAAEDAELVIKKLRTLPPSLGASASTGSTMMQLLPLQH